MRHLTLTHININEEEQVTLLIELQTASTFDHITYHNHRGHYTTEFSNDSLSRRFLALPASSGWRSVGDAARW
jgi:hypothetical protein